MAIRHVRNSISSRRTGPAPRRCCSFTAAIGNATLRRASASWPKDRWPTASTSRLRATPWRPRLRWKVLSARRAALRWLHQNLARLGGDPARLYVGGWSAGGHLTAMLMDEPLVAGGLAISGLFDLEPIRLCYLNDKLGLNAEEARR